MKNVEFCWKTPRFLSKRCLFIFGISHLHEMELNQQVRLIKYARNEISNSTSHTQKKKREKEVQKHNPTSQKFLKLLKKFP